jgi:hypothetical protein
VRSRVRRQRALGSGWIGEEFDADTISGCAGARAQDGPPRRRPAARGRPLSGRLRGGSVACRLGTWWGPIRTWGSALEAPCHERSGGEVERGGDPPREAARSREDFEAGRARAGSARGGAWLADRGARSRLSMSARPTRPRRSLAVRSGSQRGEAAPRPERPTSRMRREALWEKAWSRRPDLASRPCREHSFAAAFRTAREISAVRARLRRSAPLRAHPPLTAKLSVSRPFAFRAGDGAGRGGLEWLVEAARARRRLRRRRLRGGSGERGSGVQGTWRRRALRSAAPPHDQRSALRARAARLRRPWGCGPAARWLRQRP